MLGHPLIRSQPGQPLIGLHPLCSIAYDPVTPPPLPMLKLEHEISLVGHRVSPECRPLIGADRPEPPERDPIGCRAWPARRGLGEKGGGLGHLRAFYFDQVINQPTFLNHVFIQCFPGLLFPLGRVRQAQRLSLSSRTDRLDTFPRELGSHSHRGCTAAARAAPAVLGISMLTSKLVPSVRLLRFS